MNEFDVAWERLLLVEGGYSNHPSDKGGETRYGITAATARANGYFGAMSELPLEKAKGIARRQYWDSLRLDDIAKLFPKLAHELFDSGFNVGTARAGRWLQRSLRALQGASIVTDGAIGTATLAALEAYKNARPKGENVLLRLVDSMQALHYLELAETQVNQRAFLYGWVDKRVGV